MSTVFYLSAAIAVICTFMVIVGPNAVHSLLYLVVSFFAVAVMFFLLGAPFAAMLEIIIYAGAIMVLFVFVIMMLDAGRLSQEEERVLLKPSTWLGPGTLALLLAAEMVYVLATQGWKWQVTQGSSPKTVGTVLFGPYLIAVELASMLLLAGIVAAYHFGRRAKGPSRAQDGQSGNEPTASSRS
jgi:NADH-quinone oxidoreductase subunit J